MQVLVNGSFRLCPSKTAEKGAYTLIFLIYYLNYALSYWFEFASFYKKIFNLLHLKTLETLGLAGRSFDHRP